MRLLREKWRASTLYLEGLAVASMEWRRQWQQSVEPPAPPPPAAAPAPAPAAAAPAPTPATYRSEEWQLRQQLRQEDTLEIEGVDHQVVRVDLIVLGVPLFLLGEVGLRAVEGGGWGLERLAQRWGLAAALKHAHVLCEAIPRYKGERLVVKWLFGQAASPQPHALFPPFRPQPLASPCARSQTHARSWHASAVPQVHS